MTMPRLTATADILGLQGIGKEGHGGCLNTSALCLGISKTWPSIALEPSVPVSQPTRCHDVDTLVVLSLPCLDIAVDVFVRVWIFLGYTKLVQRHTGLFCV